MDTQKEVDKVFKAFQLGGEIAEAFREGLYSELDVDDLAALIGSLICQRVLRGE